MIHQKNKFSVGEAVDVMTFDGGNLKLVVKGLFDEKMNPVESAPHPKQFLYIKFNEREAVKQGMIIRVKRSEV